jgi:hypothetical protein
MDRNVSVVRSLFTNKLKCIQILVHAFVFYLDIKKRLKGPGNTLYTQRQNSCALQQCFLGNSLLASFVMFFSVVGLPGLALKWRQQQRFFCGSQDLLYRMKVLGNNTL